MFKLSLILFAVLFTVFLVVGIGLGIYITTRPKDIPPFDDSHLYRPVETLPNDQNAFTYYMQAIVAYNQAVHALSSDEWDMLMAIMDWEDWDADFAQRILHQSEDVFRLINEGNHCERCIVPRMGHMDDELRYLCPWRGIARLYAVKVRYHFQTEQYDEAIDTLDDFLRFAVLTEADSEGLLHFAVSNAIRMIAQHPVQNMIRTEVLETRHLLRVLSILQDSHPSTQGLTLAYKTEYETFVNMLDSISVAELAEMSDASDSSSWLQNRITNLLFNTNRTKQTFAMLITELIDQAPYVYADIQLTEVRDILSMHFDLDSIAYLSREPNPVGATLCSILAPAIRQTTITKPFFQANHRATILMTALHIYKQNTGSFPESLDALVPDILQEILLDPYDGEPMRYNPEKGIVYSVGTNLIDFGGSQEFPEGQEQRGRFNQKDIVFEIQ